MWLLTCDGDLFGGKRLWLRPGSTHLFGRTTGKSENGERIRYIENKTVSRKHLTITVHSVAPGNSTRIHTRSKVQFKDGSKIGTFVNDEKIVQASKTLEGTDFTFKLGQYQPLFRLVWHPVVLTYSGRSKSKDLFAKQRPALEAADIKLVKEYVSNETTHSVSKKRNTPFNLQALVQGRWLVADGYVDAVEEVTKSSGGEEGSVLEADFDGNWPNEKEYIPPPGTEPVKRSDEYYLPNQERNEIFSDFVFLFLLSSQYDNLLSVITSGGGKALLWEAEMGESKVEDLVEYIKEVSGQKGSSQLKMSQLTGPGGVVMVRPSDKDEAWRKFIRATENAVSQRSIEQNELLDVILTLDTSSLRQPFEGTPEAPSPDAGREPTPTPAQRPQRQSQRAITVNESPPAPEQPPPSEERPQDAEQQEKQEEQPATTTRKRQRRYITQSRFKGFDDDFDPSQFSKPASQSPAPSFDQRESSQAPSAQAMDVDEPSEDRRTQQNQRKRTAEQIEEPDEEEMYAAILPGHTAMKRQKTAAAARNGDRDALVAQGVAAEKAQTKKKKAKELDVMAEIQKRREKEEEERRKDEESLRNAMEGVDLSELKNLAQVEEMDMPVRDRPARDGENGRSERWDPAWNGLRNFKKFRPQGSTQNGPRLQRVIVALEEVPRRGQGIGDEYWLHSSRTSKSKSQSQSQPTRGGAVRSQRSGADDEHEDSSRFRRRIESSRQEDVETARADAIHPEEIAGTARDEALQAAAMQGSPSQTMRSESQRKSAGKRPAASQAGGPAKRAKQSRVQPAREVVDLDGDDDDELKFRRRRR